MMALRVAACVAGIALALAVQAGPGRAEEASGLAASPIADPFDLPAPPAVALALPEDGPAVTGATAPRAVAAAEPELPPEAPVQVAADEALLGALELRWRDPRLPLPPRLSRRDRDAIASVYGERRYRALWISEGSWTEAGRSVVARLERAAEDGLDPADYPVPALTPGAAPLSPMDLAEADAKLSAAAYLYARDARGGRIDPARISGLVTPKLTLPAPAAVLSALAASPDPGAALAAYNPAYPGYAALRAKLAALRAARASGPLVAQPVRIRQASAGEDGFRLAGPQPHLEGDIVANMERWRWLPVEVAPRAITVNVPEFRLRLTEAGRVVREARVVTGKPETPTPVFSGVMEYAIVNPSWFIPPSILRKEILPGLAADPGYAARRGYDVVRRGSSVSVRQPPGPRNALGYIKFMFPNDHAVYLHDTPSRHLFASGQRAFSHGCVRVENPFALGGSILGPAWTESRLKSLVGHGERTIFLPEKLPVHLTYFTVAVDEFGELRTFDDIYGYHRRVRSALGLGS